MSETITIKNEDGTRRVPTAAELEVMAGNTVSLIMRQVEKADMPPVSPQDRVQDMISNGGLVGFNNMYFASGEAPAARADAKSLIAIQG